MSISYSFREHFYKTLRETPQDYHRFGLYSPMGSALECDASVLRSIHSSGELKGALREQHALS